jgi:hypothetical protein
MSDCCTKPYSSQTLHNKRKCPVNGKECDEVSVKTVLHHISEPWNWHAKNQNYYFCDDPECDVVYFGDDDSVINKSGMRTIVGVKEKSGTFPICYCFGVTANQAAANPVARGFVVQKTKGHICECEVRNPSGKCCLKDFPHS